MTNGREASGGPRVSELRPSTSTGRFVLSELLENRRWCQRFWPFPHLVVDNVFREEFYQELAAEFRRQLHSPTNRFTRNMPGYDAKGLVLDQNGPGVFSLFASRCWHDMIASVMNVAATGDIIGALHHHAPGGASGSVHNDLNPGFFVENRRDDGINVSDPSLCSYTTGVTTTGAKPREVVRAVAVLFYVNNPDWQPGDGGETGLYGRISDPVDMPLVRIPPINNSLLCFVCTPTSFHSFISNRNKPRNSVTMWLHRPKRKVVEQWGEGQIVGWQR